MQFTFIQRAGEHEVFTPTAFDSQIGKTVPVMTDWGSTLGTLVDACISSDGKRVEITVEVADQSPVADKIQGAGTP